MTCSIHPMAHTFDHVDSEILISPGDSAHSNRNEQEDDPEDPDTLVAARSLRPAAEPLVKVLIVAHIHHPPQIDREAEDEPQGPPHLPHDGPNQVKIRVLSI